SSYLTIHVPVHRLCSRLMYRLSLFFFWALLVLGFCLLYSYLIERTIVVDIYY
ncbi:unnamed protein product, partial [Brassica rapa]